MSAAGLAQGQQAPSLNVGWPGSELGWLTQPLPAKDAALWEQTGTNIKCTCFFHKPLSILFLVSLLSVQSVSSTFLKEPFAISSRSQGNESLGTV